MVWELLVLLRCWSGIHWRWIWSVADHLAFRWLRRCSFLVSFGRGRSFTCSSGCSLPLFLASCLACCGNLPSHLLCWFSNSLGKSVVMLASSIFLIRRGNSSPHLLRWFFLLSWLKNLSTVHQWLKTVCRTNLQYFIKFSQHTRTHVLELGHLVGYSEYTIVRWSCLSYDNLTSCTQNLKNVGLPRQWADILL